jgi:hypothetical protein
LPRNRPLAKDELKVQERRFERVTIYREDPVEEINPKKV